MSSPTPVVSTSVMSQTEVRRRHPRSSKILDIGNKISYIERRNKNNMFLKIKKRRRISISKSPKLRGEREI